ncbi:MAG: DUF1178 family protein [Novosphingobium sp.]
MIVFDLECRTGGHRFEGWFGSSDDYAGQQERGLVSCPSCGSVDVGKAVMAPNLGRKGNQLLSREAPISKPQTDSLPAVAPAAAATNAGPQLTPEAIAMFRALATAQAEALKTSRWVGEKFADTARAIHYGEKAEEPIYGKATPDEAQELAEEGIAIAPVLFPVIPPDQAN